MSQKYCNAKKFMSYLSCIINIITAYVSFPFTVFDKPTKEFITNLKIITMLNNQNVHLASLLAMCYHFV